jgi:hypothetical protein
MRNEFENPEVSVASRTTTTPRKLASLTVAAYVMFKDVLAGHPSPTVSVRVTKKCPY